MAQQFLNQLSKVHSGALPEDAECMICQEKYGTVLSDNGVLEHAVLLPCLHHVGSECIATWLSPEDGPGNSCPMCRTVFFPERPRDYFDEEEDEDDEGDYSEEDDEDGNDESNDDGGGEDDDGSEDAEDHTNGRENTTITILDAFRRVGSSSVNTPSHEEIDGQDGQEWFERWPSPTGQQIEDSQKRARQALLRPSPSAFMQRVSLQGQSPPADLEPRVKELASAYRTMAFRETRLYLNLKEAGARIPPLEFPHRGLSAHQEEALLWELGQRGAFRATHVRLGIMAMTNRESWYVHRAKGEVYTYENTPAGGRACWITDLELDVE